MVPNTQGDAPVGFPTSDVLKAARQSSSCPASPPRREHSRGRAESKSSGGDLPPLTVTETCHPRGFNAPLMLAHSLPVEVSNAFLFLIRDRSRASGLILWRVCAGAESMRMMSPWTG
ncbi:unnamed protein product [Lampetra fluviatilis]